jgi:hypothetical protein
LENKLKNAHSGAIHGISSYDAITMTIAHILKTDEEERYSCWCYIVINGAGFEAKIIHRGRGKFKILNDEYGGKYSNKIVDASDVVRCKTDI